MVHPAAIHVRDNNGNYFALTPVLGKGDSSVSGYRVEEIPHTDVVINNPKYSKRGELEILPARTPKGRTLSSLVHETERIKDATDILFIDAKTEMLSGQGSMITPDYLFVRVLWVNVYAQQPQQAGEPVAR